jgi:putative membrane protein
MRAHAKTFFNESDREAIRAAVADAEKTTSGEIAVMAVDQSDSYLEAATLGAVLLAGTLGLVLEFGLTALFRAVQVWTHDAPLSILGLVADYAEYVSLWTYIPVVFLLYFPLKALVHAIPSLKILFLGRHRIEEAVRERALRAFYEKGLYRTRDETGILIFISFLEHRVWILGDRGINAKIAPDFWKKLARELAGGIKAGRGIESATAVIRQCGEALTLHFPIRPDDVNELPDTLLVEE